LQANSLLVKTPDQIILLADDDVDDRAIIHEIFSAHSTNILIVTAANGEEVITRLDELASQNLRPCRRKTIYRPMYVAAVN